jgi:predicted MFS family arabinose efflux permease
VEVSKPAGAAATLTAVCSGLALAALPVFLVGGLAVQIRADLGFSETQLGAAVTGTFVIAALTGPLGGRLADRIGARRSVLVGAALSSTALAGIAFAAHSWGSLALFLAVAGLSFAFVDPGLAILITSSVTSRSHGLAFGIKEASIPAATLAAGLAVPSIALTLGWRWAFAVGLIPLTILLALLPRLGSHALEREPNRTPSPEIRRPPARRRVVQVAVAAAFASAAASGVGVFLTESAVAMGVSPGTAGLLLAAGSVAGILTRVLVGVRADRSGGPQIGAIAAMMAVGAMAMAVAGGGNPVLLTVGTLGAFSAGWGWSGLLFLSLVRASPAAPGAIAGVGLAGLAIGNAMGPLTFGAIAEGFSFAVAWLAAGMAAAVGAVLMRGARAAFEE